MIFTQTLNNSLISITTKSFDLDSLKTELITSPKNPIHVKIIEKEGLDWGLLITTIIAIISTGIVIYDRVKKAKIGAKILSIAYSPTSTFNSVGIDRTPINLNGQQYFVKLSIQVIEKNFFFNDIKIKVTYKNDENKYEGRIFWADPITWHFEDGKTFNLHIPKTNFLWFNNTLPLNVVSFQYISFFVEVDKKEMIDTIELIFITPKGKEKKIRPFKISDIDPLKALFDKEIWKETTLIFPC